MLVGEHSEDKVTLVRVCAIGAVMVGAASVTAVHGSTGSLANGAAVRNGLIAYSIGGGEGSQSEVWTIRPDGTGARRLLHATSRFPHGPWNPRWSPDGKKLLFIGSIQTDGPGRL